MTIYEARTSVPTASGTVTTVSLPIRGGLVRQVFVQARTSTTVFRANFQDQNLLQRQDWGFHTGTLNDNNIAIPVSGRATLVITNASPDDTFDIYIGVQE